ncbi:hypothetical protein [Prosthecomicrobium hirschii]|uniref:hypothetical protein n=1 Tax=Prosthecodimorpha hirschii TaxID=665126 RepID=UPI00128F692B|nr:hypothetical protein [Prosthecomicrobium hirschii]
MTMRSDRPGHHRAAGIRTTGAAPLAACLLALAAVIAASRPAQAETCFRQCVSAQVTSSDMTDDQIRYRMRGCRDTCEAAQRETLAANGTASRIAQCRPEPVSREEFRAIRGASPSYVVQSNAFTWDVRNPLPGKVIREVEIVAQTMDLRDTVMIATGLVMPGDSQTVLATGFFDGYPNARYATRVSAIYACPIE